MATIYSDPVVKGNNKVRIKCDYSGTSATLSVEFCRSNGNYESLWQDPNATLTFNGRTASAAYSYSGWAYVDVWITLAVVGGYTLPAAGGKLAWEFYDNPTLAVLGCKGTITIPSQVTPPTGLSVSNVVSNVDGFTATVSVTGWGVGGATEDRYRELQAWTNSSSGLVTPYRYNPVFSNDLSGTITVSNSSAGGTLVIKPNTEYVVGAYAANGAANTGSLRHGQFVTLAPQIKNVNIEPEEDRVHITYNTDADGGVYMKRIQYKFPDGDWVTGDVVMDPSAGSSDFYIPNLLPNTTYTVEVRVMTEAGTTPCGAYTFTTLSSVNFYLPVKAPGSDRFTTKKMQKMYVGVRQPDMSLVTTKVKKLYGRGADGKTKLVFSGE